MAQHLGDPGVKVSWGYLKSWAEANGVTDDHMIVIGRSYHTVKDLDSTNEAEDGLPPVFILIPGKML